MTLMPHHKLIVRVEPGGRGVYELCTWRIEKLLKSLTMGSVVKTRYTMFFANALIFTQRPTLPFCRC